MPATIGTEPACPLFSPVGWRLGVRVRSLVDHRAWVRAVQKQLAVATMDMKRFSRNYRYRPTGEIMCVLRKRLPGQSWATIAAMAREIHAGRRAKVKPR